MLSFLGKKNGKHNLPQPLPFFKHKLPQRALYLDMITIFNHTFKSISQTYYDKTIGNLDFHRLTCSCGHSACLTRHAYYRRSLKTSTGKLSLRICRVKCSICGSTHALLLAEMVPYSQIPLISQIYIARESLSSFPDYSSIMSETPEIDESNIASICRQFKHFWKERLLSESISFVDTSMLLQQCFSFFRRQFMQIKCTANILFPIPT